MPSDKRLPWTYLATYDPTSPEYALARLVTFAAAATVFLMFGILWRSALGLFGVFCLFGALVWWRRWRRALRGDREANQ